LRLRAIRLSLTIWRCRSSIITAPKPVGMRFIFSTWPPVSGGWDGAPPNDILWRKNYPKESAMTGVEKRRHARIPVSVPVSCVSIDGDGAQLNFNMGIVKDVSQSGMSLEVIG